MDDWKRLCVRQGARDDGPYEGVPPHLEAPLVDWLQVRFGSHRPISAGGMDNSLMREAASRARIRVAPGAERVPLRDALVAAGLRDAETFLDLLDAVLRSESSYSSGQHALRELLEIGGSVWTVAEDGKALQRRVDETANEAFTLAVLSSDLASQELRHAWAAAYGRTPDPSDAWDHAIKAVEEILKPIVVPNKSKATLGDMAGQLKAQPDLWTLGVESRGIGGVETLEAMLRLIWPNPDRHGGSSERRTPRLDEAEAVLHLAVTIVQWCRSGLLAQRQR